MIVKTTACQVGTFLRHNVVPHIGILTRCAKLNGANAISLIVVEHVLENFGQVK